jgi:enamine deaminase RidA (YjgF/YER057c/UK114 family)
MAERSSDLLQNVQPEGWPAPLGYANGMCTLGRGERVLFVAGQVGWHPDGTFTTDDLADQFAQALDNVLAVVRAAGGGPSNIARMTIYVTDLDAYRAGTRAIGHAWRARMGRHFPAMALVGVAGLVEKRAKVEIEATCVLATEGAK